MMKHLAPQLVPYLVYRIVTRAPAAVYLEASIQLLGFEDPEAPTWGRMINEAFYRGPSCTTPGGGYYPRS